MIRDEIIAAWIGAKEGTVLREDLGEPALDDSDGIYFQNCPCGGDDHWSFVAKVLHGGSTSLGSIVTCFATRKQWMLDNDPARMIRNEEEDYLRLLETAAEKIAKLLRKRKVRIMPRQELLRYLHETHGIPGEIAEPLLPQEIT